MSEVLIAILIIVLALIIGAVIIIVCRKKLNVNSNTSKSNAEQSFNLKINSPYMQLDELKFLEILNRALPTECIAFPKVGVDTLLSPNGDKVGFNKIVGKYVDVCVFLIKTMEPILVIDLYEDDTIKQGLKVLDTDIIKALNSVKLPILKITMKKDLDKDELKTKVVKSIKNDALVHIITKK